MAAVFANGGSAHGKHSSKEWKPELSHIGPQQKKIDKIEWADVGSVLSQSETPSLLISLAATWRGNGR